MAKQTRLVRLPENLMQLIEKLQRPRESYADTIQRVLTEKQKGG